MIKDQTIKVEEIMEHSCVLWNQMEEYGAGSGHEPFNYMWRCYLDQWAEDIQLICALTGSNYSDVIDEIKALHPEGNGGIENVEESETKSPDI